MAWYAKPFGTSFSYIFFFFCIFNIILNCEQMFSQNTYENRQQRYKNEVNYTLVARKGVRFAQKKKTEENQVWKKGNNHFNTNIPNFEYLDTHILGWLFCFLSLSVSFSSFFFLTFRCCFSFSCLSAFIVLCRGSCLTARNRYQKNFLLLFLPFIFFFHFCCHR